MLGEARCPGRAALKSYESDAKRCCNRMLKVLWENAKAGALCTEEADKEQYGEKSDAEPCGVESGGDKYDVETGD